MYLQWASCLIVVFCALQVTGKSVESLPKAKSLQYDFNVDGKTTHENVELNREENYVKIYVPPTEDADEMTMIHDYSKGLTVCKMGGHCFLLSEFSGFSTAIDDWENAINTGPIEPEQETTLNYKMVPYNVNRTTLPPVMQRQCSDVYMTVPDDFGEDINALNTWTNGTFIFPGGSAKIGKDGIRVKRWFWSFLWEVAKIAIKGFIDWWNGDK